MIKESSINISRYGKTPIGTIKSLDALETAVRSEEMASSRVKWSKVNPYELSNRQTVR